MEARQPQDQQYQEGLQLRRSFTFYFMSPKANTQTTNWDEQIKKVGTFSTVDDFWAYYQHMQRPENIPESAQFYLFQGDSTPSWSHESNLNGARYNLRIKKKYANRVWEDLILSFIGEQCDEADYVSGLQLHAKDQIIMIYIWVRDFKGSQQRQAVVKKWVTETLGLPESIQFDYRPHPAPTQQQQQQQQQSHGSTAAKTEEQKGASEIKRSEGEQHTAAKKK